jgi:cell wall-associated NlpC family hydrolase
MIKYLLVLFVCSIIFCFTAFAGDLGTGIVIANGGLNLREGPSLDSQRITVLKKGVIVSVNSMTDDTRWYNITYGSRTGYVSTDYLSIRSISETSRSAVDRTQSSSSLVNNILGYASNYLGIPYKLGGNGPYSFDCSGFTKYVFNEFGYSIPRTAAQQANSLSTYVKKENLIPGDLVFFRSKNQYIGHVGIYVGNGDFIHASSPGDVVKYDSIYSSYYSKNYVTARRLLE